ncbi:hypothetical protein [Synechococcus sp. MIT S1220]|uniref:hypothetical protein n=1 Tax=Synechococcus sp. MIT S1220 TaxID=3082549 RepID=UPI0039B06225
MRLKRDLIDLTAETVGDLPLLLLICRLHVAPAIRDGWPDFTNAPVPPQQHLQNFNP